MNNNTYKTVFKNILGDLHTPVSTYLKLRDLFPQSFLMESSDYHSNSNSLSFIGICPIAYIKIDNGTYIEEYLNGYKEKRYIDKDFTAETAIRKFIEKFDIRGEYSEFYGIYGYTSFDSIQYFDKIKPNDNININTDIPELMYYIYKYIIIFDHFRNKMTVVELLSDGEHENIGYIEHLICNNKFNTYKFHSIGDCNSYLSDEEHKENIRRGIEHCMRGDVFQVVLSRRFTQKYEGDDFQLYRALRSINPSPYLFYFDFGDFRIFGSSPETHCKIHNEKMYIDPIAGTTKRTGNTEEDNKNATFLKNDPKENAEHVMLVDLARNDLSRNCTNVSIDFYKELQYYSHVIHLVSRVTGKLKSDSNPVKAFIDSFPAGTLSGAPKLRAIEIINELEPHKRSIYGGCIGFLGANGSINQAITIRTFLSKDNTLEFQAGGGIVAKSIVENELQEVNNKLGALRQAINLAETI